jgi:type VI secretion system protein VasG
VDNILNGTLLPQIAEAVLAKMAEGNAIGRIEVAADEQGNFSYSVA